jgi:hypothetical protein
MQKIEVDDEIYQLLCSNARPFVDSPNDVLRRLLRLDLSQVLEGRETLTKGITMSTGNFGKRSPRANLGTLMALKKVTEGDRVYLLDHSGNRVHGERFTATISGGNLRWSVDGRNYAMSPLAGKLLAERGYADGETRGPRHWYVEGRGRVQDLWSDYLEGAGRKKNLLEGLTKEEIAEIAKLDL